MELSFKSFFWNKKNILELKGDWKGKFLRKCDVAPNDFY